MPTPRTKRSCGSARVPSDWAAARARFARPALRPRFLCREGLAIGTATPSEPRPSDGWETRSERSHRVPSGPNGEPTRPRAPRALPSPEGSIAKRRESSRDSGQKSLTSALRTTASIPRNDDSEVLRPKLADLKNATSPRQMWPSSWSQSQRKGWENHHHCAAPRRKLPIHRDALCPDARTNEILASDSHEQDPAGENPQARPPRHHRRLRPVLSNTICPHWLNN